MIIILMGVCASGKSMVGRRLACQLHWPFYEGDDFHSPANVAKMTAGVPLTDADRAPWLAALAALIQQRLHLAESAVIACSALKQTYRDQLSGACPDVKFVFLRGSVELIRKRLQRRRGHYMNPALLQSQFDTLEEPTQALTVDAGLAAEAAVQQIRQAFGV